MVVVFPQHRPSWSILCIYLTFKEVQVDTYWTSCPDFLLTLSGFLWVGMERSMLLRTLRSVGQSKWLFTSLKSRRRSSCWCPSCRVEESRRAALPHHWDRSRVKLSLGPSILKTCFGYAALDTYVIQLTW